MSSEEVHLSREALYDLVWSKPLRTIAEGFDVSDVGLAKICDRLEVPRPPQGHWLRVRAGKKVPRPLLPERSGLEEVVLRRVSETEKARTPRVEVPEVRVAQRLVKPHALVVRVQRGLERARPDERGLLLAQGRGTPAVAVTPANQGRALRILDALLKALEGRGHGVSVNEDTWPKFAVTVGTETLPFILKEKLRRERHVLTPEEEEREARYGRSGAPRFDDRATGRLRIQVAGLEWIGVRQTWSDGVKAPLEEKLGEAVVALEEGAKALEERRRKWAEEQLKREEEWREREAKRRWREEERKRAQELQELAGKWEDCVRVRRFLDALEAAAGGEGRGEELAPLVAWARGVAAQMDPIPRILAGVGNGSGCRNE